MKVLYGDVCAVGDCMGLYLGVWVCVGLYVGVG